jgi:hypothetical protein
MDCLLDAGFQKEKCAAPEGKHLRTRAAAAGFCDVEFRVPGRFHGKELADELLVKML